MKMEKLGSLISEIIKLQEEKKEIEYNLKNEKEEASKFMSKMDIDEYSINDPDDKKKVLKALKYTAVKLQVIEDKLYKLVAFLEKKGFDDVISYSINIKKLEEKFENGDIDVEEIERFISYNKIECFKVSRVNKK